MAYFGDGLPKFEIPDKNGLNILRDDVVLLESLLERDPDDQFIRRCYVRAVFSFIEGQMNDLKTFSYNLATQLIIPIQEHLGSNKRRCPVLFISREINSSEIALLKDEVAVVRDNGNVDFCRSMIDFKRHIKFILKSTCRICCVEFLWDFKDDAGWSALINAVEVRNRLTHPKSNDVLEVLDVEIEMIRAGYMWVLKAGCDLMTEAQKVATSSMAEIAAWVVEFSPEYVTSMKEDVKLLKVINPQIDLSFE